MTRLVDLLCLLGLIALGGWAIDYGDYFDGVLIVYGLVLTLFLRRRWLRLGATPAQRWAAVVSRAAGEIDSW